MQVGRGSGTTGLTWLLSDHPSLHSGQALGSTSITADGATIAYVGNYYEWSGSTGTSYYYAGSMRVAMRQGGTLYYLFGDHLGSTSVVATSSGSKSAEVRYRAWGEDRFASGTAPTSFRFTGQRVETSLGLYFYGARWYDASLGRFLSPDSIVPDAAQGVQAWDRYAYSSNNPLKYIDPTGHNAVRSMSFGEEPPPPRKPSATPRPSPASPQDIFKSQQTPTPQGPVFQPGPTSTATPSIPLNTSPNIVNGGYSLNWGWNVSGSNPLNSSYYTMGQEEVVLSDGTRATYDFGGQGNSVGAGASITAYVGVVANLDNPEEYNGNFASAGVTISAGGTALTVDYFWNPDQAPFSTGNVQGFTIGYSPGAEIAIWWAVTNYYMTWKNR